MRCTSYFFTQRLHLRLRLSHSRLSLFFNKPARSRRSLACINCSAIILEEVNKKETNSFFFFFCRFSPRIATRSGKRVVYGCMDVSTTTPKNFPENTIIHERCRRFGPCWMGFLSVYPHGTVGGSLFDSNMIAS
jgi:hypothetical protein